MPLSTRLYDTVLTHACPHCGNKVEKPGSYFWRMRHYHCLNCQEPVTLSYDDKLKLFDDQSGLAGNNKPGGNLGTHLALRPSPARRGIRAQ